MEGAEKRLFSSTGRETLRSWTDYIGNVKLDGILFKMFRINTHGATVSRHGVQTHKFRYVLLKALKNHIALPWITFY